MQTVSQGGRRPEAPLSASRPLDARSAQACPAAGVVRAKPGTVRPDLRGSAQVLFISILQDSVRVTAVHTEAENGLRVHSRAPYFVPTQTTASRQSRTLGLSRLRRATDESPRLSARLFPFRVMPLLHSRPLHQDSISVLLCLSCLHVQEFTKALMKIWQGENPLEMKGYSIARHVLFDILAQTPQSELLPCEKVFVAIKSGVPPHDGYLTDAYMASGCFEQARAYYASIGHTRKLGDLSWIIGDLDAAEAHYLNPQSDAQSYRTQPDHDRLIKLAFVRGQWSRYVERFQQADFSRGFTPGHVICGRSEVTARPYLEMLAISLNNLEASTPPEIKTILTSVFKQKPREWETFRGESAYSDEKTTQRIQKRSVPRAARTPPISVDEATAKGDTRRARHVLDYLNRCDAIVTEAQQTLERFAESDDDAALRQFIQLITGSGIMSASQTVLFSALGHSTFLKRDIPPDRKAKLLASHPVMNRHYFGDLLEIKFEHGISLTGEDVLTGLFQQRGSFTALIEPDTYRHFFDIRKLAYFRGWAAIRLDDWLGSRGAGVAEAVAETWRAGTAAPVKDLFGGGRKGPPKTPRNMVEWNNLLNAAAKWLEGRWKREIGKTTWVSENQLYQLLKRKLKAKQVIQHAQPAWVAPQHLDVFIPVAAVAVEYMGRQHFEPVEFFGGPPGFAAVQERDNRKAQACQAQGVELHIVRYDEDVGARAQEIACRVADKLTE